MTTPYAESLTTSASKRARSTNNSRSGTPTPVPKAIKTEEDQASSVDASVPAFLRQSASGRLLRHPCIRDANLHDSIDIIGQRLMLDRNQI